MKAPAPEENTEAGLSTVDASGGVALGLNSVEGAVVTVSGVSVF